MPPNNARYRVNGAVASVTGALMSIHSRIASASRSSRRYIRSTSWRGRGRPRPYWDCFRVSVRAFRCTAPSESRCNQLRASATCCVHTAQWRWATPHCCTRLSISSPPSEAIVARTASNVARLAVANVSNGPRIIDRSKSGATRRIKLAAGDVSSRTPWRSKPSQNRMLENHETVSRFHCHQDAAPSISALVATRCSASTDVGELVATAVRRSLPQRSHCARCLAPSGSRCAAGGPPQLGHRSSRSVPCVAHATIQDTRHDTR